MQYITVHVTRDDGELARLKSLFEKNGLDVRIEKSEEIQSGKSEQYVQVMERDSEAARKLLQEAGYHVVTGSHRRSTTTPGIKWMFVFLAALVLLLVAILITWFMNAG